MLNDFLKKNIKSQASYVEVGYGQVEPNHLSAQRTAQIYAQLPADKAINVLEQGQFVKYDYASGLVNFTGAGEWMLVYNEIKLYREHQIDCEFALVKDDYVARVYSPLQADTLEAPLTQSRYFGGKDDQGNDIEKVTHGADPYEFTYNENPFEIGERYKEAPMPEGTTMVPRVFKTNVGDIFTTNTINAAPGSLAVGNLLSPGADGILAVAADNSADMVWQVVKVYTMPDGQPGVKIMRIK